MFVVVSDISFLCSDGRAADFETRLTVSVIHQVKTDKLLRVPALSVSFYVIFFNHLSVKKWCGLKGLDENVMMT